MRKYLIPVLALVMVAAGAFTAHAEWKQNGNDYYYYNGNELVKNQIVEDDYYVDQNGKMVVNTWVKVQDGDEQFYCYFGSNGKMIRDKWQTIADKTYHFDDNGYMERGWIQENMYFCHLDDGHLLTGWQRLEDPDTDQSNAGPLDDANIHWYYFNPSTGRKYCAENGEEFQERRIDSKRYCFNQIGALQTGWVKVADGDGIGGYKYYDPNGADRLGWYSIEPPEELKANYAYDVMWFYFLNTGFAAHDEDGIPTVSDIRRIGTTKKRYYFNEWGTPVWGLRKLYTKTDGSDWDTYFFGTFNQSCVQHGKFQIYDGNDKPDTFYFQESGTGYNGPNAKDGCLYYKGKLQKASTDLTYEAITVNDTDYLVNTSGKIVKKKTVKDKDGTKWATNASGVVCMKDDHIVDSRVGRDPEAPSFGG